MKRRKRQKLPTVEVFDPRRSQDFRIPYGEQHGVLFSSMDHDSVVVDMSWKRGWSIERIPIELVDPTVVCTVLQRTADIGFLCVYPGDSLGGFSSLGELEVHKYGEALLSHFPPNEQTVASFLNEASTRGTYEEWLIGSAMEEIDLADVEKVNSSRRSPDLIYFLARFSMMGSVLAFDLDNGEFLAVFRTFDGYEDAVLSIVRSLKLARP